MLAILGASGCTSSPEKSPPQGTSTKPVSVANTSGEPWATSDLLAPAALAAQLRGAGPVPVVFDMGPSGTIQGAQRIGPAQEEASLTKLRAALRGLPKDQPVVVYCGCCPFDPCPNIRPAFQLLKDEGFTQAKLLNLPHNLKADWIDAGYPMARAGK